MMDLVEFVLIVSMFGARKRRFMGSSEESGAQIEAARCQKHCKE
ncbi:hypothetical protein Q2941_43795 [Bradyrhizobium sp. UFLA05-153]